MSDLTEFLLARVAEDERRRSAYWHDLDCARLEDAQAECDCGSQARVLAECEAKRRIVEDFEVYAADARTERTEFAAGRRHAALLAVVRIAVVYAEHPGFREEWRP